jgi:hypothetical protein
MCTLFLTLDEDEKKVVKLAMSWNAASLFRELGVQLKEEE